MPAELNAAERKLAELILYVSARCSADPHFGAIKLNKVLFHVDFGAYAVLGKPVTGVEYQKLELGPAPRPVLRVRDALVDEKAAAVQKTLKYIPRPDLSTKHQVRIIPLRDPDLGEFGPDEIAWIDAVIDMCHDASGNQLATGSHNLTGWKLAREHETIPYSSIFVSERREATDYEKAHAEELIQTYGWTQ